MSAISQSNAEDRGPISRQNKTNQTGIKNTVYCYLPPKINKMVNAYSRYNEESKSSLTVRALRMFFDSLPPAEVERMLRQSDNSY